MPHPLSILTGPEAAQDFDAAWATFLLRCQAQALSERTVQWYAERLGSLRRFLATYDSADRPGDLQPDHLRAFFADLQGRNAKHGTVDGSFRALKTFFGYLHTEGYLPRNPMAGVARPRGVSAAVHALTAAQAQALLGAPNRKTWAGLRDYTLMVLMLDAALRVSEALGLALCDVDLGEGLLAVMGKGRKARQVPVGRVARRALVRWLQCRGDVPGQDLVFCTRTGDRVERRLVERRVSDYGRKAGISGVRVSPHTLRHTAATMYLRQGGNPLYLQRLLGHSTLAMTNRYLQAVGADDLRNAHRTASPMDGLE